MIKSFFKINDFDEILKVLLSTEKEADNFLSFIKIIGNEGVMLKLTTQDDKDLNEVVKILRNIVNLSKDDQILKEFIKRAFNRIIVDDSIATIQDTFKAAPKDVASYFKSEQIAYKTLNPFILVEFLDMVLDQTPETIFECESGKFKKLLTILLLNAMIYRGDQKLLKKLYGIFLNISIYVAQNVDFVNKKIIEDILTLKILSEMIKKTNFDYGTQSVNNIKVTDEQKLILEIIF